MESLEKIKILVIILNKYLSFKERIEHIIKSVSQHVQCVRDKQHYFFRVAPIIRS